MITSGGAGSKAGRSHTLLTQGVAAAESDPGQLLDELVARVGSHPVSSSQERMSFPETRRFWAELGEPTDEGRDDAIAQPFEPVYLFSKSEFFRQPLPREAVAALLETFSHERNSGESRELDFMPWGGAYNRVRPDATAFVTARSCSSSSTRSSSSPMPPRAARRRRTGR
jgi:hypothetical protein